MTVRTLKSQEEQDKVTVTSERVEISLFDPEYGLRVCLEHSQDKIWLHIQLPKDPGDRENWVVELTEDQIRTLTLGLGIILDGLGDR